MSKSIDGKVEGKRVFNWRSKSCRSPNGTNEEIEFGLVDPQTRRWLIRISVLWMIQHGDLIAIVQSPLAVWNQTEQFKDIAGKLAGLTKSPVELPPFRVALALCSEGYEDVTEYVPFCSESEIRKELREAEERVERLKDRLAGGYYQH